MILKTFSKFFSHLSLWECSLTLYESLAPAAKVLDALLILPSAVRASCRFVAGAHHVSHVANDWQQQSQRVRNSVFSENCHSIRSWHGRHSSFTDTYARQPQRRAAHLAVFRDRALSRWAWAGRGKQGLALAAGIRESRWVCNRVTLSFTPRTLGKNYPKAGKAGKVLDYCHKCHWSDDWTCDILKFC